MIHQANGGQSRARNAGMRVAKGDYFVFCDADDMLHPRLLEQALAEAELHPHALVTWRFTEDPSCWDGADFSRPPVRVYEQRDLLAYFGDRVLFNSPTNKLYPRAFLREHQIWFDPAAGNVEDYAFFTAFWKVFFACFSDGSIREMQAPFYFYNPNNANSVTHTTGATHTRDFSGYCRQQLELYAQTKEVFGPLEQYPVQDVLSVIAPVLNSIAYGLCQLPHPHCEVVALWQMPAMREISQWHRRHRVHNMYLFFLRLRWASGVKFWFDIRETRPALFSTAYHLGYRRILKP